MKDCLIYKIKDNEYIETRGEGLVGILSDWLRYKGFDALVYDFALEGEGNIIVDYSFDEIENTNILQGLVEQLFKRFNINFKLEDSDS